MSQTNTNEGRRMKNPLDRLRRTVQSRFKSLRSRRDAIWRSMTVRARIWRASARIRIYHWREGARESWKAFQDKWVEWRRITRFNFDPMEFVPAKSVWRLLTALFFVLSLVNVVLQGRMAQTPRAAGLWLAMGLGALVLLQAVARLSAQVVSKLNDLMLMPREHIQAMRGICTELNDIVDFTLADIRDAGARDQLEVAHARVKGEFVPECRAMLKWQLPLRLYSLLLVVCFMVLVLAAVEVNCALLANGPVLLGLDRTASPVRHVFATALVVFSPFSCGYAPPTHLWGFLLVLVESFIGLMFLGVGLALVMSSTVGTLGRWGDKVWDWLLEASEE